MRNSRKMTRQLVVASSLTLSAAWHRQALRKAMPELLWLLPVLVFIWLTLTYVKVCQSLEERLQKAETQKSHLRKEVT